MEAISFESFSMKYREGDFSLDDINLKVNEGDFVVLTGGTGSGKSTLLRQLKREFVSSDYSGSVKVFGCEMHAINSTLEVGYVMQHPLEQIVTDKVFHELSFGLENMGLTSDEIRLRVSETAHYFGLSRYMDKATSELSGGEMQILNLASVMAMRPRILLLDEPTSQLDEVAADKLLSLVYRINRELGTTVIVAEHRLDMLDKYTSVVIMDKGRIAYNGKEPKGYDELPIYNRVGEALSKPCSSIVECRHILKDAVNNGDIVASHEEITCDNAKKDTVLSCRDVWYRYTKSDRDVLKGVDLRVNAGETLSIVGANGVGKSTLLKVLSGVSPCYKGKVNNHGNKVIYIPQNLSFASDSVGEEVANAIDCYVKVYKEEIKSKKSHDESIDTRRRNLQDLAQKYMEKFDLKKVKKLSPYEISGGERAKLAILLGLLASPRVLLFDEPTKGLDRASKQLFCDTLRYLKSISCTSIVVSHDIELVSTISDRVATLFDGEIVSICTPKLLLRSNYLFTTTTSRITRGILDDVVSEDELMKVVSHEE